MRFFVFCLAIFCFIITGCGTGGDVVHVMTLSQDGTSGLEEAERARLAEIKKKETATDKDIGLERLIQKTPNFSVQEYLSRYPTIKSALTGNYTVGGYDVISITVYEEPDLSRENVNISADGKISFPLIGQVKVADLTTSEIEQLISDKLAEDQYLLNAHVSVTVVQYNSKKYKVLGSVVHPGAFPLHSHERLIDAISQAGGIDFNQADKTGMIIRTLNPNSVKETKQVIRFDLNALLKEGDQLSNLLLIDKDLVYIPTVEYFYIIGEVQNQGAYPYLEDNTSLIEAISKAGGFTKIAARNKTRIVRVEDGVEKIIEVKVDKITNEGMKGQDIIIQPGDVIVVPESLF